MMKRVLTGVGMLAVGVGSAAAELPPKLAVRDQAPLKGWAHVAFGSHDDFKITNGVDTISFRRMPPQPQKEPETLRGPDGRSYSIGVLGCTGEAYLVIGDFDGKVDASALAPMKAFACPSGNAEAFEIPDESQFQDLATVKNPGWFKSWISDKRPGPFGIYMNDDQSLIVIPERPSDDRTKAGRLASAREAIFKAPSDKNSLQAKTQNGATLYVGHEGTTAIAARVLPCDGGALFIVSRVEHGKVEQAIENAAQLRCRVGKEPSIRTLATPLANER